MRECQSYAPLSLSQGVAKGKQYDLAIMDSGTSFDVIPHKCLFEKPQYYGINGQCQDCIADLLKNRSQRVVTVLDSE